MSQSESESERERETRGDLCARGKDCGEGEKGEEKDSFVVMKMEGIIGENNNKRRRIRCLSLSSPVPVLVSVREAHRLKNAKTHKRSRG